MFSGDTLIIVSPFLSSRGIANQTIGIDDRLSFERARHRQKKNFETCIWWLLGFVVLCGLCLVVLFSTFGCCVASVPISDILLECV